MTANNNGNADAARQAIYDNSGRKEVKLFNSTNDPLTVHYDDANVRE